MHGDNPPMAEASVLLKGYGACLCIHKITFFMMKKGRLIFLVADTLYLKELALLEVSMVHKT